MKILKFDIVKYKFLFVGTGLKYFSSMIQRTNFSVVKDVKLLLAAQSAYFGHRIKLSSSVYDLPFKIVG